MLSEIHFKQFSATIDSAGAQLMSLTRDAHEYLWQGDKNIWPRRAPNLFPIVGALRDNHAHSNQGEVTLSRHGLARNFEHEIVAKSDATITFELKSSDATRAQFPFDFTLQTQFELSDQGLTQRFVITNPSDTIALPYMIGAHPAFTLPLGDEGGLSFNDYELEFTEPWAASTPRILDTGLVDFSQQTPVVLGDKSLRLKTQQFAELLTITLTEVPGRSVTLKSAQGERSLTVSFPDFSYLGLWTANETGPFIAIEPWTGVADALDEDGIFEHKRGCTTLSPHELRSHELTILPA